MQEDADASNFLERTTYLLSQAGHAQLSPYKYKSVNFNEENQFSSILENSLTNCDDSLNDFIDNESIHCQVGRKSRAVPIQHWKASDLNKHGAFVLKKAVEELEQNNMNVAILLKESNKYCRKIGEELQGKSKELVLERANILILHALKDTVNDLLRNKRVHLLSISELEKRILIAKKKENHLKTRLQDVTREAEDVTRDNETNLRNLHQKLAWSENELKEKSNTANECEKTLKEYANQYKRLEHINGAIKEELKNCLCSASQLKRVNHDLQYSKEILEGQVGKGVKSLKSMKGWREQRRLQLCSALSANQSSFHVSKLLKSKSVKDAREIVALKETMNRLKDHLKEYKSGERRSIIVIKEMKKLKSDNEFTVSSLTKRLKQLEFQVDHLDEEIGVSKSASRKLNSELSKKEADIRHFQENHVEKRELETITKDLRAKYNLDMNTQIQKFSFMFHEEKEWTNKGNS